MTGCTLDLTHVLAQLGMLVPFEPLGVALLKRQGCTGTGALCAAALEIIAYVDHCAAIRQQLSTLPPASLPLPVPGFVL